MDTAPSQVTLTYGLLTLDGSILITAYHKIHQHFQIGLNNVIISNKSSTTFKVIRAYIIIQSNRPNKKYKQIISHINNRKSLGKALPKLTLSLSLHHRPHPSPQRPHPPAAFHQPRRRSPPIAPSTPDPPGPASSSESRTQIGGKIEAAPGNQLAACRTSADAAAFPATRTRPTLPAGSPVHS